MKHLTIIFCVLIAGCGHTAEPYPDGAWPAEITSARTLNEQPRRKLTRHSNLHIQCPNGGAYKGTLITDQPLDADVLCASVAPIGPCALLSYKDGTVWGSCEENARTGLLNRLDGFTSWCITTADGVACYEGEGQ